MWFDERRELPRRQVVLFVVPVASERLPSDATPGRIGE
jgi:hypothetical protein